MLVLRLVKHVEAVIMRKMKVTLHCLKLTWEENINELIYNLFLVPFLYYHYSRMFMIKLLIILKTEQYLVV